MVAVAAPVAGLAGRLGPPGIGIGAVLMMVVANPWSGVTSAPELLPEPAGVIGQWLPPGAAGSALRERRVLRRRRGRRTAGRARRRGRVAGLALIAAGRARAAARQPSARSGVSVRTARSSAGAAR